LIRHHRLLIGTGLRALPRCCAHQNFDFEDLGILRLEQAGDEIEIAIVDPGFQKCRRDRETDDALRYRMKLEPRKPAGIDIGSDLSLKRALTRSNKLLCATSPFSPAASKQTAPNACALSPFSNAPVALVCICI
jgi:hypothetical protein